MSVEGEGGTHLVATEVMRLISRRPKSFANAMLLMLFMAPFCAPKATAKATAPAVVGGMAESRSVAST